MFGTAYYCFPTTFANLIKKKKKKIEKLLELDFFYVYSPNKALESLLEMILAYK